MPRYFGGGSGECNIGGRAQGGMRGGLEWWGGGDRAPGGGGVGEGGTGQVALTVRVGSDGGVGEVAELDRRPRPRARGSRWTD